MGPGLVCNMTNSESFCTCTQGVDSCTKLGHCQPTLCAKCQTCLQTMASRFVAPNLYHSRLALAASFNTSCAGLQLARDAQICATIAGSILSDVPHGNSGRRAGLLCKVLSQCDAAALSDCSFMVAFPGQKNMTGALDLCTVQGVSEGNLPEGVSATEDACVLSFNCLVSFVGAYSTCGITVLQTLVAT
jgi:hypothetical protein